jgi:hypothetical protein
MLPGFQAAGALGIDAAAVNSRRAAAAVVHANGVAAGLSSLPPPDHVGTRSDTAMPICRRGAATCWPPAARAGEVVATRLPAGLWDSAPRDSALRD